MKSNASLAYNLFLVIGDFLALVAAFVGAYFIRSQSNVPVAHPLNAHTYVYIFLGLLPFWILIFALLGLYNSTIYERRFSEFGRLLVGSFIGMLFVIFWNFLSVDPIFPAKLVPLYGMALAFVFLVLFRNIARLVRTELFGFNIGLTHIALVGSSPMTRELVESLANSRQSGYKVVAVVGDKRQVDGQPIRTYPTFKRFLYPATQNCLWATWMWNFSATPYRSLPFGKLPYSAGDGSLSAYLTLHSEPSCWRWHRRLYLSYRWLWSYSITVILSGATNGCPVLEPK
jgi:hypothetical protein